MKLEDCWWLDYENCLQDLRDRKRLTKAEHLVLDATFAAYFSAFGPDYKVKIFPTFVINANISKVFGQYKFKDYRFNYFEVLEIPEKCRATFRCHFLFAKEEHVFSRGGAGNIHLPRYGTLDNFALNRINPKSLSYCLATDKNSIFLIETATKQQYENKHGPITYPKSEK